MNDVKYKIWYEEFDSLHSIYIFKSPRGGAKSYSLMDYSINDFIDNFNQFFWLRRKESEILTELPKLIPNKIMQKYGILNFKCKKGGVFITFDNKNYIQCGFYGAISTFKKGQRNFENVKTIVFDEFNDTCDLISNERFKFWNAIATIVDTRKDYKLVFLGNETIYYSPYEYLEERTNVCKTVEIKELDVRYVDTPLFQAVNGTDVGSYMFESNYFKNFKYFYNNNRFNKINKEIIINYNDLDFYYIKDDDVIVVNLNKESNNKSNREEFNILDKTLKTYYNRDKFYYTNKDTYKKVSEVLPDYIK